MEMHAVYREKAGVLWTMLSVSTCTDNMMALNFCRSSIVLGTTWSCPCADEDITSATLHIVPRYAWERNIQLVCASNADRYHSLQSLQQVRSREQFWTWWKCRQCFFQIDSCPPHTLDDWSCTFSSMSMSAYQQQPLVLPGHTYSIWQLLTCQSSPVHMELATAVLV